MIARSRAARRLDPRINNHSDYFYQFVYGDKDTFLLAWVKLATLFAMTPRPSEWCGVAINQYDFLGKLVFQHRCGDKWRYDGANLRAPGFLLTEPCAEAIRRLRRVWHGEPWSWRDQTPEETAAAIETSGRHLYDRVGIGARRLELLPGGRVGEGRAGCEERWTLRLTEEGPRLVLSGRNQGTAILRPGGPGRWLGRWERVERCPVELRRLDA